METAKPVVDQSTCQICSAKVEKTTLKCKVRGENFGNEVTFLQCAKCGFSCAPENLHDFSEAQDFVGNNCPQEGHGRVGTGSQPGREYHMAIMAKEILQHAGLPPRSILIYGPGLSRDHLLLAKQFPEMRVYVCDLKNFQHAENFVAIEDHMQFDVVIACEVVEHFTQVISDFSSLFSKVSKFGIAVLSTNISDGGALFPLEYPFIRGHTAYYSGRALALIASQIDADLLVDFRAPQAALAQLGPRKRYVLIYRGNEVAAATALYFSANLMAPSEALVRPSAPIRWWRWLRRQRQSRSKQRDECRLRTPT
jgi:hypothetical protein